MMATLLRSLVVFGLSTLVFSARDLGWPDCANTCIQPLNTTCTSEFDYNCLCSNLTIATPANITLFQTCLQDTCLNCTEAKNVTSSFNTQCFNIDFVQLTLNVTETCNITSTTSTTTTSSSAPTIPVVITTTTKKKTTTTKKTTTPKKTTTKKPKTTTTTKNPETTTTTTTTTSTTTTAPSPTTTTKTKKSSSHEKTSTKETTTTETTSTSTTISSSNSHKTGIIIVVTSEVEISTAHHTKTIVSSGSNGVSTLKTVVAATVPTKTVTKQNQVTPTLVGTTREHTFYRTSIHETVVTATGTNGGLSTYTKLVTESTPTSVAIQTTSLYVIPEVVVASSASTMFSPSIYTSTVLASDSNGAVSTYVTLVTAMLPISTVVSESSFTTDQAAAATGEGSFYTGGTTTSSNQLSTGAKAGIGVGVGLGGLLIILLLGWFAFWFRRRRGSRSVVGSGSDAYSDKHMSSAAPSAYGAAGAAGTRRSQMSSEPSRSSPPSSPTPGQRNVARAQSGRSWGSGGSELPGDAARMSGGAGVGAAAGATAGAGVAAAGFQRQGRESRFRETPSELSDNGRFSPDTSDRGGLQQPAELSGNGNYQQPQGYGTQGRTSPTEMRRPNPSAARNVSQNF